uniref:Uncharacterized protein n=1 Tax=Rhipicephalus appendiculatus TaxID=34631 RepID=A0A131Z630_RHIAP
MMWAYFFIPCLVYGFVEAAYSSERNNLRRECPGQAERHGSTTCVRTPCRSGTKFSCMIKDGQPYKACVPAGDSCEKNWQNCCGFPYALMCRSPKGECECTCSKTPSWRGYK